MKSTTSASVYWCAALGAALCLPLTARPAAPLAPARLMQEPVKAPVAKNRPANSKSPTDKPAASTVVMAKKTAKNRPGKRFWTRIMDVFRDVHSAEKKQK